MDFSFSRTAAWLTVAFALTAFAFADRSHDRTEVSHNITVQPDEEVTDATCFGCSVRIKGHVSGDVTTFGGSVIVEGDGRVDGDLTTLGGNVRLERETEISGDLTLIGGRLYRDQTAMVGGDVSNIGGGVWIVPIIVAPFVLLGVLVWLVVWLIRRLLQPATVAA